MLRTFAAVTSRPAGHAYHVAVVRAQVMPEIVVPGSAEFCAPVPVIVVLASDPVFVHEPGPHAAGRPGVLLLHPSVAELQEPLVGDSRDQRRPVGRSCDKTRTKRGLAEKHDGRGGNYCFLPSSSTMRYTNVLSPIVRVYGLYGKKNDRSLLARQSRLWRMQNKLDENNLKYFFFSFTNFEAGGKRRLEQQLHHLSPSQPSNDTDKSVGGPGNRGYKIEYLRFDRR